MAMNSDKNHREILRYNLNNCQYVRQMGFPRELIIWMQTVSWSYKKILHQSNERYGYSDTRENVAIGKAK